MSLDIERVNDSVPAQTIGIGGLSMSDEGELLLDCVVPHAPELHFFLNVPHGDLEHLARAITQMLPQARRLKQSGRN